MFKIAARTIFVAAKTTWEMGKVMREMDLNMVRFGDAMENVKVRRKRFKLPKRIHDFIFGSDIPMV